MGGRLFQPIACGNAFGIFWTCPKGLLTRERLCLIRGDVRGHSKQNREFHLAENSSSPKSVLVILCKLEKLHRTIPSHVFPSLTLPLHNSLTPEPLCPYLLKHSNPFQPISR